MTLHGIDVSHWQSGLDLAKTDAQFVIAKATEGTDFVDATCDHWVSQSKKLGHPWGVYHFYKGNPTSEADFFIKHVAGYLGHCMIVLDFEYDTWDVAGAHAWLERVYDKTGIRPLLYASQSVIASQDWTQVRKDTALWVARYNESIGSTGGWPVTMWQYTDAHATGGMKVDGDRFYGDKATWSAFAAGSSNTRPDDEGDDDMPLSKEDVEKVADAVWAKLLPPEHTDGLYTEPVKASLVLRRSMGFAHQAAENTKK